MIRLSALELPNVLRKQTYLEGDLGGWKGGYDC